MLKTQNRGIFKHIVARKEYDDDGNNNESEDVHERRSSGIDCNGDGTIYGSSLSDSCSGCGIFTSHGRLCERISQEKKTQRVQSWG